MLLEWLLIVILHGDPFGVVARDSYTTFEECEVYKQGVLEMAAKLGDTDTVALCAAREVVKKETI
jgi:hypothetical protein